MASSSIHKAFLSMTLDDQTVPKPQSSIHKAFLSMTLDDPKPQKLVTDKDEEDQPKKIDKEIDVTTTQWISVYTKRPPMKQRYHYNVENSRVDKHVQKGMKDGLFISSVASSADSWAMIMDSGTGFSSQVYQLSPFFMHKEWIIEQWEKNYFITSIAGANNGSTLVVMSKGTPYTQQSYKIHPSFPSRWIQKKWDEGFHVTSMTTSKRRWCVVTSKNSGYSEQVVDLNFLSTSEKVHPELERGYMITSVAATPNQAALVLSKTQGEVSDERQETLRTSTFPRNPIRKLWAENMFVTSMCYGRTAPEEEESVNSNEKMERKRKQNSNDKMEE